MRAALAPWIWRVETQDLALLFFEPMFKNLEKLPFLSFPPLLRLNARFLDFPAKLTSTAALERLVITLIFLIPMNVPIFVPQLAKTIPGSSYIYFRKVILPGSKFVQYIVLQ